MIGFAAARSAKPARVAGSIALFGDDRRERPLVPLRVVAGVAAVAERGVDQVLDDRGAGRLCPRVVGLDVVGYEIRHGTSTAEAPLEQALPDGLGWAAGPILGVYLHGLFEQPRVVEALLGEPVSRTLDDTFDRLADAVDKSLDMDAVAALAGLA